jgi:DNA-directed RNA polymerase subunit RPC12/RpoP
MSSDEKPNEQFLNAPRLSLGKNTCSDCKKDYIVSEQELPMPGTKDLESVYCPYCSAYNGEVFINGLASTRKIDE